MSDNLRTPEPPNPLDVFLHRPYSELFAFIYEEEGANGLRQLHCGIFLALTRQTHLRTWYHPPNREP